MFTQTPHLSGGLAEGFHLFPFRTQKLSLHTPMVLDWRRSGRVGSRRNPTKQKTMQCMVFCFVCTLETTHSPVLETDCAQLLTCDMTEPSAASGRASAAEERGAKERLERALAPTHRDYCAPSESRAPAARDEAHRVRRVAAKKSPAERRILIQYQSISKSKLEFIIQLHTQAHQQLEQRDTDQHDERRFAPIANDHAR